MFNDRRNRNNLPRPRPAGPRAARAGGRRPLLEQLEERAAPAAGVPDLSFGTAGRVETTFPGYSPTDGIAAVVVQRDGKIVAAGTVTRPGTERLQGFALARYDADGSLDPNFGTGGRVTTDFGEQTDVCRGAVLQPDGKIVVAGRSHLVRYNPDGTLDPGFGMGGQVALVLVGQALVLQSDGKVVVVGSHGGPTPPIRMAAARYNPDGTLDASFGTNGLVTTASPWISPPPAERPYGNLSAVAVQPDGKIIAAGQVSIGGPSGDLVALVRYSTDGSLDPTFGDGGRVASSFGPNSGARGMTLQPDGKIVVVGSERCFPGFPCVWYSLVARYNSDGSRDRAFGSEGEVEQIWRFENRAVAVQPDGKLVVGGGSALERYLPDGRPDAAFGTGGWTAVGVAALALQPDGRIVTGGPSGFTLIRYLGGPLATGVTLSPSDPAPVFGQPLTLTATVRGAPGLATPPAGTVTFWDGAMALGTALLTGTTATLTVSALATGPHAVTATYGGDADYAPGTSPPLSLSVRLATTATLLAASPFPAVVGQPLTLTATVSAVPPGSGIPAGTVTFLDGTSVLGSAPVQNGRAVFTTTALVVGPHALTAAFGGDANFAASVSPALNQPAVCNPNQMFVAALYHDLLGRTPDAAGFTHWVARLDAGANHLQVAEEFWHSAEHRGVQVDRMYAALLHRPADPPGRATWTAALMNGAREEAVAFTIALSTEYTSAHPGVEAFVTGLYQDLLGRDPDTAGMAHWQAVARLPLGLDAVVAGILGSSEHYSRLLDLYYRELLGRTPDPAGKMAWLTALETGRTGLASTALSFLGSDEYYTAANQWDLQPFGGGRYCGKR